jgi:hypothetical protein
MTTRPDVDHELAQHLRRTFDAVAASVTEDPPTDAAQSTRRSRRHRPLIVGAGTAIAAIPLAAAAVVGFGPEHVDRIPPADPIVSGSVDGERYWVVDGRDVPRCEGHPSGIEMVVEENNIVGQEWNTVGYFFGIPTDDLCAPHVTHEAPARTYDYDGGQTIGDGMVWAGALHPEIDQVRVSLDSGTPFDAETFTHEGGTYFVLEIPPDTDTFRVDYVTDGEVVAPLAGERAQHDMARD